MVAIGGDVRLAAAQLQEHEDSDGVHEIPSEAFLAFCDEVERLDDEGRANRFRLPGVEAETLLPALLIYRAILSQTAARSVVISDASLRIGMLLDFVQPKGRLGAEDFERQVLASADAVGHRFRFDRAHGHHVAMLATRLFDDLQDEHGLSGRDRLLLQTAGLLHDVGLYVSLREHHKHSQYLLAASQIFGLSNEETAIVSNIARYHRGRSPQESHLPFLALDRGDRLLVTKLAAILRVANALDAEHLQKVRDVRIVRGANSWLLEVDGSGDITMEQMAARARTDMFAEVFGRQLVVRVAGATW
jgi:exopolyphosphatase/guanosine-5'-triphosphate,3'-diphosphate pyrophosphatase